MAQLLVIIGFASANWREETPQPVYLGHDDEAGENAMRESGCAKFIVHRNLTAGRLRDKPPALPVPAPAPEVPPAPAPEVPPAPAPEVPPAPTPPAKAKSAKKSKSAA